jgi:hypothetical protein
MAHGVRTVRPQSVYPQPTRVKYTCQNELIAADEVIEYGRQSATPAGAGAP